MSRSYWLSIFVVVGWLALSAASAQQSDNATLKSQPVPAPQHSEATDNYGTSNGKEGGKPGNLLSILREIEAAIQNLKTKQDPEKDKRDEYREKADLKAQEDMAFWAKTMVWTTILSLLISIASLFLIWRSLRLAREAIHAENRPWLDFEIKPVSDFDRNDTDDYPEGFGVNVQFLITNHGKSPAVEVLTRFHEVKITPETVLEDFDLNRYRARLAKQVSKNRRPRSTVFPSETSEMFDRIIVSKEAVDDAVEHLKVKGTVPDFSLKVRYIAAVYYRSATSPQVHETSVVFYLHMLYGKHHTTSLVFRKSNDFKPIGLSKIKLFNMQQKRAN